jgi:hypothetical protein
MPFLLESELSDHCGQEIGLAGVLKKRWRFEDLYGAIQWGSVARKIGPDSHGFHVPVFSLEVVVTWGFARTAHAADWRKPNGEIFLVA